MTSPPNWQTLPPAPETNLQVVEGLYFFDEPLIFVSKVYGIPVVCNKVDERRGLSLFLVCPTTDRMVRAVKDGAVSVRAAFDSQAVWMVETDPLRNISQAWNVAVEDITPDYLPDPGTGLYPHHGFVADRFRPREQTDAFLSFKFAGGVLHGQNMSFDVFKSLVDRTYATVKSVFLASIFGRGTDVVTDALYARMLDIPMARAPEFASLRIELGEPGIKSNKVKRKVSIDEDAVSVVFRQAGEDFISSVASIAQLAEDENFQPFRVHSFANTVDLLAELVPHEKTAFDRLEVTACINGQERDPVVFTTHSGHNVRQAFQNFQSGERSFEGKITSLNEKRSTLIITTPSGREITCSMPSRGMASGVVDFYAESRRLGRLPVLTVSGDFKRRPRRDMIVADLFILPDGSTLSRLL